MFRPFNFFRTSSRDSCANKAVNTPTLTCDFSFEDVIVQNIMAEGAQHENPSAIVSDSGWRPFGRRLLGGRYAGRRGTEYQSELAAFGAQNHRPARGGRRRRADDLPADPHRHQPGNLWIRRSAGCREQDLCADAEEPYSGRE